MAIALGLLVEVIRQGNRIGRILSVLAVYDVTVLVMVALRAAVTALQAGAAWSLWREAPAGPVLGRWAFTSSAALLVFELGLAFSPSSVTPGLRWPSVAAYGAYACVAIVLLGRRRSDELG
jgi:hypothetical protein